MSVLRLLARSASFVITHAWPILALAVIYLPMDFGVGRAEQLVLAPGVTTFAGPLLLARRWSYYLPPD